MSTATKPAPDSTMFTHVDYVDQVTILNPMAIVLDGLDEAVIGITSDEKPVLVYGMEKCIETVMKTNDMKYNDAYEWLEYNSFHTYYGDYSPIFINEDSDDYADMNYADMGCGYRMSQSCPGSNPNA